MLLLLLQLQHPSPCNSIFVSLFSFSQYITGSQNQASKKMSSSAKPIFLLLVLWLSASGTFCARKDAVYGDGVNSPTDCQNCSICPYQCRPQSPPPLPPSGYPTPAAPPPPAVTGNNCPPTPPGCCQYPQSSSPPSPPSPYTYVPYNNYSASPPTPLSTKPPLSTFFINVFLFGFVSLCLV